MKRLMIPVLSVSLLLGSSWAHAMKPKTAKDFDVDENSPEITHDTLNYAEYLISNEDGDPTDDEIRKSARVFLKSAALQIYDPYGFVLMLAGNDEKKLQEMLHQDEDTAVSLFLQYYKKLFRKNTSLSQDFSNLTLDE